MKALLACFLVFLAACATTAPAPVEYLLRPPLNESPATPQSAHIALGRVEIAPYLDQSGIVLATGDHRIQIAEDHRWAEPLSQSVRRTLAVDIGQAAGEPVAETSARGRQDVVIDVHIHRLHGSLQGKVVLDADWQIVDAGSDQVLGRYRFAHSTLTDSGGYDALVQAHVSLLQQLAQAIAGTLPDAPGEELP